MNGIYAILDELNFDFKNLCSIVGNMIDNDIKYYQIRVKRDFTKFHIDVIEEVKSICRNSNCYLLLNDNVEISKKLDLDGVHLGQGDTNLIQARRILGESKIIGISCYNDLELALLAEKNHASYVSFGSLYDTNTKKNFTRLNELDFKNVVKKLNIPTCLIGGINISNIHHVKSLNSDLIAISEGLSSSKKMLQIVKAYAEN
tara:strand:+ start:295 stop:900 length:606 start_codon:yes stop_codon:yes gene_type:complete